VIVIEKPKSYHKAIRGIGKGFYPDGYLAKEPKGWDRRRCTRFCRAIAGSP
jgi:hypothetical protein